MTPTQTMAAPARPPHEDAGHSAGDRRTLLRYVRDDRTREIVELARDAGCTLVVDREAFGHGDVRLLAELAPDEPAGSAELIARMYRETPRACRRLDADDDPGDAALGTPATADPVDPVDVGRRLDGPDGVCYRIARLPRDPSRELRWVARAPGATARACTVRDVVGALEAYEPVLAMTEAAIADPELKTKKLDVELEALKRSRTVLNRGLREAVVAAVARGESYSDIAIRCNRLRRERQKVVSGETSWLKRRVGLSPEAGSSRPTPWVRTDVFALIAREGLGRAPRELEAQ